MSQARTLNLDKSQTETIEHLPKVKNRGLLSTMHWLTNSMDFLYTAQKHYGDNFIVKIPGFDTAVFLSHPQAVKEVFSANQSYFDASVNTNILQPLIGVNSILRMDDLPHQRQRKLLMPPFHGAQMLTYGQLICDVTKKVISQWSPGQPFSIRPYSQKISLGVMLSVLFGLQEGERYEQFMELLTSLFETFNSPLGSSLLFLKFLQRDLGPMSPWGRFLHKKKQVNQLLNAEIHKRRTQALGEDILSLMMSARDEQGQPMTDAELRDELMTLMFGGTETSANTISFALNGILNSREVSQKLLDELNTLPSDADSSIITKLPYLNAVVCETLRLHPVVLFVFSRRVKFPLEIMGYQLEPGTIVTPCNYLTQIREDIFPEPKRFKPERFLEHKFAPYEYYPFGGGNRRCIGAAFAQFEIKLALATILSQVQLSLADNRPVRSMQRGITISPSEIRMLVTG